MRIQKALLLGLIFVAAIFLVSCAAGPNVLAHSAGADGRIAGFTSMKCITTAGGTTSGSFLAHALFLEAAGSPLATRNHRRNPDG
jgi:hypothetical protein